MVLLEAIVVPQYNVSISQIQAHYNSLAVIFHNLFQIWYPTIILQMQDGFFLAEEFESVEKICETDWKIINDETTLDSAFCRRPEVSSSELCLIFRLKIKSMFFFAKFLPTSDKCEFSRT